jgi:signal peptidase I
MLTMEIIPPKKPGHAAQTYHRAAGASPEIPPAKITPEPEHRPGLSDRLRGYSSTAGLFIMAFFIAILLNTFVIQSYQVDGQSMEPTLQNNDRLIVNKMPLTIARIDGHQYIPKRSDIIIFNQDGLPGFIGTKQLIKRVIGLPGERVVVSGDKITVFNSAHPDGFNPDSAGNYRVNHPTTKETDITLSSDQLFVCGDNRPNSEDSRFFGPINTDQVVAKLVLRILPITNTKSF